MSESGGLGGGTATSVATVTGGAVALPLTSGNMVVSYVILTAMVCAGVVIASKIAKSIASRFIA
jgi:hypothetical protein